MNRHGAGGAATDGEGPVGLVMATEQEAATPLSFWVYVDPQRYLQLDDVVHMQHVLPDGQIIDVYGVVDEVRAVQEGVRYDSDVALARDGVLPAETAVAAHVAVTRIDPEIYVPPRPGEPVEIAHGLPREIALFFDKMHQIPFGVTRSLEPVFANLDFLDGTRGAHVNISGISGVATKTTYATFLLYSLFEGEALGTRRSNTHALIFNVKGEDLLFLDRPNTRLDTEHPEARAQYAAAGLPVGPFGSVAFYAPVRPGWQTGDIAIPNTGSRTAGVTAFYWTLREFCTNRYLRFLFADADDDRSQIGYVVQQVETELLYAASTSLPVGAPTVQIGGDMVTDFAELVAAIARMVADGQWGGRAAEGTKHAFLRRLEAAAPHVGHLVRGAISADAEAHQLNWQQRNITVIDINRLHDRAQRFVVGVVLKRMFEDKESTGSSERPPLTFVVLDELNKYAPREGHSPIKDVLLDIAERGRSLGVVLIGAQQTASEVEQRVVSNCAYRIVGRLDSAEAARSDYGFLSAAARARASLLKPGTMIVHQPEIPVPLLVQFPFPAWATRAAEAAPVEADPFARFERGRGGAGGTGGG